MTLPLDASTIPLYGRHLIEASAGTGKTYNITRLYLRLLLEKELTVQQILVMTFTKDATEEIRGRIEGFLRLAIDEWDNLTKHDVYFTALNKRVDEKERQKILYRALINLDEASIFTIHGFCKRVLNQHAFLSGVAFNAKMEVDAKDLIMQSCQDWYRRIGQESAEHYQTIAQFWPTPESFVQQFFKAINHSASLNALTSEDIEQQLVEKARIALTKLKENEETIVEALIDTKKGTDKQTRIEEYAALCNWLKEVQANFAIIQTAFPKAFIDGKRFSRTPHKEVLKESFTPCQQLIKLLQSIPTKLIKAKALAIAKYGIYQIREQLLEKKLTANMLTFDDLISVLADNLSYSDDSKAEASKLLANTLAKQYPAALIDEFQDTDPQQFRILSEIYHDPERTALYLIGDPKQAIYGFRGGDVFAYLQARNYCENQWIMDTNWRSSPGVIAGYNRLFYGDALDKPARDVFKFGIEYQPVNAGKTSAECELDLHYKPIQFIHFDHSEQTVPQSFRKNMSVWCANEIIRLLDQTAISAKDIAVLVRDGTEAADIKEALLNANLGSVYLSNRANLWHSAQSEQLITLLKGIVYYEDKRLFNAALTSQLLQLSPNDYLHIQNDEQRWQYFLEKFAHYRQQWSKQSFITMAINLMHDLMAFNYQQDRELTNVLHLFELLQSASQRHRQPTELLSWFEQQVLQDNAENEAELRLESEENLIKIITQHGSKGLEYPVVFIPFSTRHKDPLKIGMKNIEVIEYHDQAQKLQLSLDANNQAKLAMAEELYAESVRLLYVAITRAENRCYILTANFDKAHLSPLGQVIQQQDNECLGNALLGVAEDMPMNIGIETVSDEVLPQLYQQNIKETITAKEAQFIGSIERDWWLSSFTSLSRNIRDFGVSNPDRDMTVEVQEINTTLPAQNIRFDLEKGARTGNLLHDILESLDFEQANIENRFFEEAIEKPLLRFGELSGFSSFDLMQWLKELIRAPFSSVNGSLAGFSLAKLSYDKTLRECEFYFPLSKVSTKQLVKLLSDHRNRMTEEISGQHSKFNRLALPNIDQLNGMMHGFIDLIFEYQGRYYLADYKSNHLGDSVDDYQQEALLFDIQKHHYDLQYLIYSVALHRFLKQKLPDYSPEEHFGGCMYFYLRAMSQSNQHQQGIYFAQLTAHEINSLDRLFGQPGASNNLINEPNEQEQK